MDEQGLSAANRALVDRVTQNSRFAQTLDDCDFATTYPGLNALLDAARSEGRSPPPGDVREEVARIIYNHMVPPAHEPGRQGYPDAADAILALSALPIQGGGWRAMDSAPPRTHVLATRWSEADGEWIMAVVLAPLSHPFTHWRPLPAPPVSTEETK